MTAVQPTTDTIVHNPRPAEVVGSVPIDDAETVAAKARELRLFQPEWEAMGPRGRRSGCSEWQEWVPDNLDHLTEVLMSETGKVALGRQHRADPARRWHQLLVQQCRGLRHGRQEGRRAFRCSRSRSSPPSTARNRSSA